MSNIPANLKKVYIGEDGDGHTYIIPAELYEEFNTLLEKCGDEDDPLVYDWQAELERKYGKYLCDNTNYIDLYADIN